jgi:hypothetical protein
MKMAARIKHFFLLAKITYNSSKAELGGHISEAKEKTCMYYKELGCF